MRAKRVRPVLLFALAAVVVVSCRDAAGPGATGYFALAPSFASAAAGIVEIAQVRVQLFRADESLALDETVTVPAGADSLALELTVRLREPDEVFQMFLDFITPTGDTAFRAGPVDVTASSTSTEPVPIEVNAIYVGVGANAASVAVTTTGATLIPGQTKQLSAEARDDQGQPIPGTPIAWASLDPARATFPDPAVGSVVGGTTPGPVLVTATLLTGPADTVSVTAQPAPEFLLQRGGDGQSGPAGSELPLPLIVEVLGNDIPIEGASVLFTTGDGGSFSADSVVTDASGRAQTMWTLGPGLGTQTTTATVSGFTSVSTTFTATAVGLPVPQIVFAGDSSGGLSTGIFTVNSDGSNLANVQSLIPLGFQRQFPRWSPDRSRIAYSWDGGFSALPLQLYVASADGAQSQAVVTDTSTFRSRWSPDGVHLAFECGNGFSIVDVCVIADVTGAIGSLPANTYAFVSAAVPAAWKAGQSGFSWDPQNPSRLAFARDSGAASPAVSMLWTAAHDGAGVQRLAPDGLLRPNDSAPLVVYGTLDYSPDGQQIVFAAYSPVDAIPEEKLFVINRDGTGLRQLTFLAGYDDSPLFSPDGSEVAFGRDRCFAGGSYEGWIVDINNATGSLERQITDHGVVRCDFELDLLGGDWSPDGSEIVLNGFDVQGNLLIYVVPRTVTAATYPTDRKLAGRGVDLGGFVQDIQPSWRP